MENNVVITVFDVESEAFQAFNELSKAPKGEGYTVLEAALIRNSANVIEVCDGFGISDPGAGTATGMVIGSLVGILGGPVGVLLGASAGACVGGASDARYTMDTASALAVIAGKIYEGEIAIAAVVGEEEPAFDAAFANYNTTVVRYDAADIADDVERMYEIEAEFANQVEAEMKAERKAERKARREEHRAKIRERLEEAVGDDGVSSGMAFMQLNR